MFPLVFKFSSNFRKGKIQWNLKMSYSFHTVSEEKYMRSKLSKLFGDFLEI